MAVATFAAREGGPQASLSEVLALVIPDVPEGDVAIPGSESGFAALVSAQAAGDAQALADAGRRVARTTWASFEQWIGQGLKPTT